MQHAVVMDRTSFFAWAEAQPGGRYERIGGEVVRMSPERVEQVILKNEIWRALDEALSGRKDFRVLGGGMTISVDDETDYEPDVSVNHGPRIPRGTIAVPNPVSVAGVLSPSTQRVDSTIKRRNYFRVPSVQHYLTFRTDRREVMHWRRDEPNPRELTGGEVRLDPPDVVIDIDAIYARAERP